MKKFSVIIPVYNRPIEVDELLESLNDQTVKDFEIVIVEDGSIEDCKHIIEKYHARLDIKYHFKDNSGPGDSRNFGMKMAKGEYLIFFDSDCIIPADYFEKVSQALDTRPLDAYGGPDNAHNSFTIIQKAINYAMTSSITTGGIRGKSNNLDNYQPRSFNMGIRRNIFEHIDGFRDIHPGEDPDLSYRIMAEGYQVGLIEEAYVFHKRRVDFSKFIKQVYKFGVVRPILIKWYPDQFKLTYLLPSLFLLMSVVLVLLAVTISWIFISPLLLLVFIFFVDALIRTKNITTTLLAVLASFIQLYGYGYGFLKSAIKILILGQEERKVFPNFFFKNS